MAYALPRLMVDRLGPVRGCGVAALLIVLVAAADSATGYGVRLSILYLGPIALAAWTAGIAPGIAAASFSSLLWMLSFSTQHFYPHSGYFFWEAAVDFLGFVAFAVLIARLRLALGKAEERFFSLMEAMHAAVYVSDPLRDEILYANSEARRMSGDAGGTRAGDFESRFARESDGPRRAEGVRDGEAFESRTVRDQRSGRWYLMQDGPIPWNLKRDATLTLLSDISAQKEAELMRERHLDVLHNASKLITLWEIATTVAHEINQPLMVIATYADACERMLNAPVPDVKEIALALARCRAQSVRASQILERLREFIRQRQHHPEPCDARLVVEDAIDVTRPFIDAEGVTLVLALPAAELRIVADKILLIQVMVNLIRNGIEAMEDCAAGSRKLSIAVEEEGAGGVLFSVTDSGHGLGSATIEQLQSPFFTTRSNGLGLGLSISRTIAEAHGGRLWAENCPLDGAVFRLSIPRGGAAE